MKRPYLAHILPILMGMVLCYPAEAQQGLVPQEPPHTIERFQQLPEAFPPREFFLEGLLMQYEGDLYVTDQTLGTLWQTCGEGTYWGCTKTNASGLCQVFIEAEIHEGLVELVRWNLFAECAGWEVQRRGSVAAR